ncbi:MAG: ketopantoate reductase family protein [Halanaeroarchaeum sp.]
MHVVVLGAGSLGSLLAGRLAAIDATVTLLGRPDRHLETIRRNGLVVERPDGGRAVVEIDATPDHERASEADLLVLAVKSYDTASAMGDVAPHLEDCDVLTVQNGLGNAETVADFVPEERVAAGTTTHGATVPEPGRVVQAGTGDTVIGRYFTETDEIVHRVAALLTRAGLDTAVVEDVVGAVWEKVLVNVGINAATALARVPNGELVRSRAGTRLVERAVEEGRRVAAAEGRPVQSSVVERTLTVARETATNRSSMRQDVEAGSKTEVEALNGAIVRRGNDHDVPTPVNRTLADLVRLTETRSVAIDD